MFLKISHLDDDATVVNYLSMRDGITNEFKKMVLQGQD